MSTVYMTKNGKTAGVNSDYVDKYLAQGYQVGTGNDFKQSQNNVLNNIVSRNTSGTPATKNTVLMKDFNGNTVGVDSSVADAYKKGGWSYMNEPTSETPTGDLWKTYGGGQNNNSGGISSQLANQYSDYQSYINDLAEAQKQAALAGLEKSKNQSLSDLTAAKGKIEPAYYTQRNAASTDAQVAARNFAEYMAQRGSNNPVGNSGSLAQSNIANNLSLQGNLGSLATGEAADYATNAKQVGDVNTAYNSDVASAEAGVDATKLQNLINAQREYNTNMLNQYNADRTYNYQVGRDVVNDTGYTQGGVQTLAAQQALAGIQGQNLSNAAQATTNKYLEAQIKEGLQSTNTANQLAALQLKYQPQIYAGQINAQALTNAYQKLVNQGYPKEQAADLAYKAAQMAATKAQTNLYNTEANARKQQSFNSNYSGGGKSRSSSSSGYNSNGGYTYSTNKGNDINTAFEVSVGNMLGGSGSKPNLQQINNTLSWMSDNKDDFLNSGVSSAEFKKMQNTVIKAQENYVNTLKRVRQMRDERENRLGGQNG